MAVYDKGDKVRLQVTFKEVTTLTLTDPTTVTLKVTTPSGAIQSFVYGTANIVKSSTGVYYYDYPIELTGTHRYRWIGSGNLVTAEEAVLFVRKTAF